MAVKAQTVTLVANTAQAITLTAHEDERHVDVTVHSAAVVYVRTDATTPVVGADENFAVVGPGFKRFRMPGAGIVRIISSGTPVVTVSAVA